MWEKRKWRIEGHWVWRFSFSKLCLCALSFFAILSIFFIIVISSSPTQDKPERSVFVEIVALVREGQSCWWCGFPKQFCRALKETSQVMEIFSHPSPMPVSPPVNMKKYVFRTSLRKDVHLLCSPLLRNYSSDSGNHLWNNGKIYA